MVTAVLLMTQRLAPVGALSATPILTTILAFCWSTKVYPTASVVTLMWLATLALVAWDLPWWRARLASVAPERPPPEAKAPAAGSGRVWERAGGAALALYLAVCAATGGVYRPRGPAWRSPEFYVFPAMLLVLVAAWLVDRAGETARSRR